MDEDLAILAGGVFDAIHPLLVRKGSSILTRKSLFLRQKQMVEREADTFLGMLLSDMFGRDFSAVLDFDKPRQEK